MKLKTRLIKKIVGATFGVLFISGTLQAETLQEAVKYMQQHHPDVRTAAHNRLARDQQVRQARSAYFPKLDFITGIGIENIDEPEESELTRKEFTLALRQNVFHGFESVNEVDRQKFRVNSAAYMVQGLSENTALDTARVYIDALRQQELVTLAQENLMTHERIADQIKLRSESGVSKKADLNQAEGRLALARSNVVVTETNLLDTKTNYLAVVGHLPENLTTPGPFDDVMPVSLEEATELAINNHPTLKSAEADVDARKMQDKVAKGPFWPIVDIEVDKNWEENIDGWEGDQEDLIAMLRIRYNLFHGWTDRARKLETAELISEAREIRNHTNRQVVESIRLSWMAHQAVLDRIKYLEQHVTSSSKTADAFKKQWEIGQRTLFDVLDTDAEVIEAKQDLLNARFDGLYAQCRILNGTGQLVHTLDLEWPEESYVDSDDKKQQKEEKDKSL